ncbi:MAG: hypothetical protein AAGH73_03210 [Pseudomonadota bacterium]
MKNTCVVLPLLTSLVLSGCAQSPENIAATYVSPLQFQSYSCNQLVEEGNRVGRRAAEVAGVQQKKADQDAGATAISLVLFWPAAFFIKGDKETAAELARLKGELEAIEQASIRKNCGIEFRS